MQKMFSWHSRNWITNYN